MSKMISLVLLLNVAEVEKKEVKEKQKMDLEKKMMILKLEIPQCPEHKVKSKIIFVNEKILEEYSLKIYKIDPYFYEHYKEKNTS